ncbi:MAG: hypothetical protein ACREJ3_13540, partial [Polyangiaceae bacterium]
GQPIRISERRVLTFKASQILKHALNQRSLPSSSVNPSSPRIAHNGASPGTPQSASLSPRRGDGSIAAKD